MNDQGVGPFQINAWWAGTTESGTLTKAVLSRAWARIAVREKLMGYKDIEWDIAIDDAMGDDPRMTQFRCDRPPPGWECYLPLNHIGPCPAHPKQMWLPPTATIPKRRRLATRSVARIDPAWMWQKPVSMAAWDIERFERTLWTIDYADLNMSSKNLAKKGFAPDMGGTRRPATSMKEANLISSLREDGSHAITLDIDHHAELIPSSTAGNFHLYIDVPMEWWRYKLLLRVLAFCGVIEWGYARASIRKGGSFLRLPWIKKSPF